MFGRREKNTEQKPLKSVTQTEMKGTELHINPPPDVSLKRLESRLARVEQSISSGKWPVGSSKEMEFQTIKRRLKMQIALLKGDY